MIDLPNEIVNYALAFNWPVKRLGESCDAKGQGMLSLGGAGLEVFQRSHH